jgi:hypothetical protein
MSKNDAEIDNIMAELKPHILKSLRINPTATVAALLTLTKNAYLQVHSPRVSAYMFYKVADYLALVTHKVEEKEKE